MLLGALIDKVSGGQPHRRHAPRWWREPAAPHLHRPCRRAHTCTRRIRFKSPAAATATDAPGTRTNTTLSGAQESNAKPFGGQASEHCAPFVPAKAASAR